MQVPLDCSCFAGLARLEICYRLSLRLVEGSDLAFCVSFFTWRDIAAARVLCFDVGRRIKVFCQLALLVLSCLHYCHYLRFIQFCLDSCPGSGVGFQ